MERIDDLQYENLKIIQNTDGFRFGIDSVLLTEFARDIKNGCKMVDLGTGTGIISILLSKKVKPKEIIAIEKQAEVADMARRSVELNELQNQIKIINCDIKDLFNSNKEIREGKDNKIKLDKEDKTKIDRTTAIRFVRNSFDVVVTNPPYKKKGTGIDSATNTQQLSRVESTATLADWVETASNLLNTRGSLYMVYRTDRMSELIECLNRNRLQIKRMRFVHSKVSEQSNLVLIKAVKDAKIFVTIEKPLIIYNEDGSYTEEIKKLQEEK